MKLPDYTLTISEPVACIKPGRTLLFRLCFALVLLIGIPAVGVLIWAEVTSFNLNSLPWLPRIGLAAVVGLCAFGVYRSIREEQVRLTLRFYKDRLVLSYEGKPSLWREGTPAEETVIRLDERLAVIGSKLAVSDAGTSAMLAHGALCGAYLNVRVNTRLMKDREYAEILDEKADVLLGEYTERALNCFNAVMERMDG